MEGRVQVQESCTQAGVGESRQRGRKRLNVSDPWDYNVCMNRITSTLDM